MFSLNQPSEPLMPVIIPKAQNIFVWVLEKCVWIFSRPIMRTDTIGHVPNLTRERLKAGQPAHHLRVFLGDAVDAVAGINDHGGHVDDLLLLLIVPTPE